MDPKTWLMIILLLPAEAGTEVPNMKTIETTERQCRAYVDNTGGPIQRGSPILVSCVSPEGEVYKNWEIKFVQAKQKE